MSESSQNASSMHQDFIQNASKIVPASRCRSLAAPTRTAPLPRATPPPPPPPSRRGRSLLLAGIPGGQAGRRRRSMGAVGEAPATLLDRRMGGRGYH
eukprot:1176709-Prorocentrum_minimum.AAC.3